MKDRFLLKANIDGDCIVWLGSKRGKGYGAVYFRGKMTGAHRVSYILNVGEIPDGLHVLHHCDNRLCVKPEHLFLGSNADNMRDKALKNRQPSPISNQDVLDIRAATGTRQVDLAQKYGVTRQAIHRILNGKSRRHIA